MSTTCVDMLVPNFLKYYLIFSFISQIYNADGVLYEFKANDVLSVVEDSCLVAGILPLKSELADTLQQLVQVFGEEAGVAIGTIEINNFKWLHEEVLKWKDKTTQLPLQREIAVFRKRKPDRTCLLTSSFKWNPIPELYTGPQTLDALVELTNSACNTFRTIRGSLSSAGLHREYILSNMFNTSLVTNMTMGEINKTPQNPWNQSYQWHGFESNVCEMRATADSKISCFVQKHQNMINRYAPVQTDDMKMKEMSEIHNYETASITQCERISRLLTKEEFFNEYVKKSKPVIMENAISHWPAFSKWTNEFLEEEYGDREVHIKLTPGGDFEGVEKADLWEDYATFKIPNEVKDQLLYPDLVVVRPAGVSFKFSEFMAMIKKTAQQETRNLSAYLEYSSIPEYMPNLEKDIKEPDFMSNLLDRRHLNIWLSDGNTLGRLHFDPFDNLLCQISGRKQSLLFEPHQNENLYEAHIPQAILGFDRESKTFRRKTLQDSTSMVMSPVDVLNPNFLRFPRFADVRPLNCTLTEGDVLYMPAYWWHEVQSFPSETEHRNLAVNFWYEPFLTREFPCPECPLDVNPHYHHLLY